MKIRILITFLFLTTVAFTQNKWLDHISFEVGYRKLGGKFKHYEDGSGYSFPNKRLSLSENRYGDKDYVIQQYGNRSSTSALASEKNVYELFLETVVKHKRWSFPFFVSMEQYDVVINGNTSNYYRFDETHPPTMFESWKFDRSVVYGIKTRFYNFKLGVGYNLIDPSKKLKIGPICRIGIQGMGKLYENTNAVKTSFKHDRQYTSYPYEVLEDTTINAVDANNFIEINRKYKTFFYTVGIQTSYLIKNKFGINLECGYQTRGRARYSYESTHYFKYGMYASLGVVHQIALKGK